MRVASCKGTLLRQSAIEAQSKVPGPACTNRLLASADRSKDIVKCSSADNMSHAVVGHAGITHDYNTQLLIWRIAQMN